MGVSSSESVLPLDVIIGILLWLPVASLLRFKLVSRDWLSLIESSHFVHRHRRSSKLNNQTSLILLSRSDYHYATDQQFSLFSLQNHSALPLDFPIIHDPFKLKPIDMVASCHGLICLRQNRRVCVWNPSTNQSTNLPPLLRVPAEGHLGFGFDLKTNCYKVVCINQTGQEWFAHIYSSGSNYWRTKPWPVDVYYADFYFGLDTPYHDNIYCWLLGLNEGYSLLSFDCSNEALKTIPLPLPKGIHQNPKALFILRENIAFINEEGENSPMYQVWMLNDYNVKGSWTKLYLIQPIPIDPCCTVSWFSKDSDFLLLIDCDNLCLYDVVAQEFKILPVPVAPSRVFRVVAYEESLVSFERGSGVVNRPRSEGQHAMMSINQSVTGSDRSWGDANITQLLLFEILLWLPVTSLLRFKLVCQPWCSLIESSEFVTRHLHLHQNDNANINFILQTESIGYAAPPFQDSSYPYPATSHTCLLSANKLELVDAPYHRFQEEITISLDGIICLHHGSLCDIFLWNPATKQFRVVREETNGGICNIGFGFDVKSNDYRLVRFFKDVVKVYSLRTGSWRSIPDDILRTVSRIYPYGGTPYRRRINCWLARNDYDSDYNAILSFDFSNEVLETIALPDGLNQQLFWWRKVAVLRENIACIAVDKIYNFVHAVDWRCEIWMMNEYGVKDSWTKLYTVGPFLRDWCWETQYSKKNADYILLRKDGQLYEYELATKETKKLLAQVPEPEEYHVIVYKESLVSIK